MNTSSVTYSGLPVDTNLLVLFVVGAVNRERIESFERTSSYTKEDYKLLLQFLANFKKLHTSPHVLAEVSNLADLCGGPPMNPDGAITIHPETALPGA